MYGKHISGDYVVYLQESNFEIGTKEDLKLLMKGFGFHNPLIG